MVARKLWLIPLSMLLAGGSPPAEPPADLVVHEWGTFLAMSGSDGVSLDGMYHEEHALPSFVHARGRDQLRPRSIFIKGETPVIYFYTAREQNAYVEVKFPSGVWTQWYPQSQFVLPRLSSLPVPATDRPKDGRIVWSVRVVPDAVKGKVPATPVSSLWDFARSVSLVPDAAKEKVPAPPSAPVGSLWNFARDVDAALVLTYNPLKPAPNIETEKFLFYRGLGTAPLPLRMSADAGGTLTMESSGPGVSHVFVLRVEGGKAAYAYRPALAPGETVRGVIPTMERALPVKEFADAVSDELATRLVESGLFPKEARAMVNTWRSSYFETDGVRALFVLPQSWTDGFIPLKVSPLPKAVTRVMVGRVELLTPDRERLAEAAVRDLGSPDPARRLWAFETLKAQGRYVEPIVRRVLLTTKDESVVRLGKRLLLADFVTDLRSAVRSPAATTPLDPTMTLNEDPLYIRARLAGLLREVGMDEEAKAEGAAALAEFAKRTPAKPDTCESRHDLKATALGLEGTGDDRGAAARYGKLVDLAALAVRTNDCRKCHQEQGPRDAGRLRDWWAGDAYARAVGQSEGLDPTIVAVERERSDPKRADSARLRLAYLYEARGRLVDSEAMWTALGAARRPVALSRPAAGGR